MKNLHEIAELAIKNAHPMHDDITVKSFGKEQFNRTLKPDGKFLARATVKTLDYYRIEEWEIDSKNCVVVGSLRDKWNIVEDSVIEYPFRPLGY